MIKSIEGVVDVWNDFKIPASSSDPIGHYLDKYIASIYKRISDSDIPVHNYCFPIGFKNVNVLVYFFSLQYKKRLLLRCIYHFKSDLITIWIMSIFWVPNPRQWSLAKQRSLKC